MALFSDDQMWKALKETHGNYSRAARLLSDIVGHDLDRGVVWARVNRTEENKKKYLQIKESILDNMEKRLQELATSAESEKTQLESIKYYLNNQGKHRGWNAEQEQSNDFNISIHFDSSPKNELENDADYESTDSSE